MRNKEGRRKFSQQLVTSKKPAIHVPDQFSSSVKVKTIKLMLLSDTVKMKELLIVFLSYLMSVCCHVFFTKFNICVFLSQ